MRYKSIKTFTGEYDLYWFCTTEYVNITEKSIYIIKYNLVVK